MLGFVIFCCLSTQVFSSSALWPSGKYGLPMPKSGCPGANDFTWTTGYIIQDLQDGSSSKTTISSNSNLQALVTNDVQQYFCIKSNQTTVNDAKSKPWPAGEYCIYQKGKSCPAGMSSGSVFWDDENANGNNKNAKNGSLPEGVFNEDTKIFFCCQTNGVHSTPIKLPVNKPFYLIAVGPYCQLVLNTVYTLEYIEYDTEDDNNHDKVTSPHPFGANLVHPRIYYCYYQADHITTPSITTAKRNDTRTTTMPSQTNSAPSTTTPPSNDTRTTLFSRSTRQSTLPWVKTSSAPATTTPPSTPDANINDTETTAAAPKSTQQTSTDATMPGPGTTVGNKESVLETDKGSESNSPGTVIYIIIGIMAALIVAGCVVAVVVFYYFRDRHKNGGNRKAQERIAVVFSREEDPASPQIKVKSDTNNRERYENVGSYRSGCDGANDLNDGDCQNPYEEIKDKGNPLYGFRDGYSTYEELKSSNNPLYHG